MTRFLLLLLALSPAQEKSFNSRLAALAQDKKKPERMDYGPFLAGAYTLKAGTKFDNGSGHIDGPVVSRGIAVKLGESWESGAVFDADTLRMAGAWTGGAPKWTGVIFDGAHGPTSSVTVPPTFLTPIGPGWAKGADFKDPRPDSIKPLPPPGPLPREWAKFRGHYRHGDQTVFSYTVGNVGVLETIALEGKAFSRTFRIDPSDAPMHVMLAEGDVPLAASSGKVVRESGRAWLEIEPHREPLLLAVVVGATEASKPVDVATLTKGGPARWGDPIETKGVRGTEPGSYVVDRLTLPEPNPWRAKMRVGGFDFFADGARAALCTWDGDVWIVSGIDEKLEKLSWRRFATGLYQPLGLRIVDDVIYAVGHDQITRLHDLNGDGEADFYENFNNDWELTTAFHTFCFDLQTDPQGNFYFAFNAPVRGGGSGFHKITAHHGTILKVSKDGAKLDVYATGFRANNGIGVGPGGEVTSGDNEGSWVPRCPLHWVKPGSFNGVVDAAHRELKSAKGKPDPSEEPKPVCWMPKNVDNSGGGQVWVSSDRWGPFRGELLHMSYGTSSLYKVLMEEVEGVRQGGVVKFPLRFTSSAMRGRFNPKDGQLYVAGLRGWQSNAAKEGGFDRVRHTGEPVFMPTRLKATKTGLAVTFTGEVDSSAAEDPGQYAVSVWNYRWTAAYGSGEFSTLPEKKDAKKGNAHDALEVKSARLSPDRRTVFLEIVGIKPVHQMKIALRVAPQGGKPVPFEIYNTIHVLGD